MSTTASFQVPVAIQPVYSPHQFLDTLFNLEVVLNQVYGKIQSRLVEENTRVSSLSNRVINAQEKITKIHGVNNAITVLSPSRYPASSNWQNYHPIEYSKTIQPPTLTNYEATTSQQPTSPKHEESILDISLEIESSAVESAPLRAGLGKLPSEIKSVSSLLLFNSKKNPYKSISDPKEEKLEPSDIVNIRLLHSPSLFEAPPSISAGTNYTSSQTVQVNYIPVRTSAPSFSLPKDIPHLKNVASNTTFAAELDLPDLETLIPSKKPNIESNVTHATTPMFPQISTPIQNEKVITKTETVTITPPITQTETKTQNTQSNPSPKKDNMKKVELQSDVNNSNLTNINTNITTDNNNNNESNNNDIQIVEDEKPLLRNKPKPSINIVKEETLMDQIKKGISLRPLASKEASEKEESKKGTSSIAGILVQKLEQMQNTIYPSEDLSDDDESSGSWA